MTALEIVYGSPVATFFFLVVIFGSMTQIAYFLSHRGPSTNPDKSPVKNPDEWT